MNKVLLSALILSLPVAGFLFSEKLNENKEFVTESSAIVEEYVSETINEAESYVAEKSEEVVPVENVVTQAISQQATEPVLEKVAETEPSAEVYEKTSEKVNEVVTEKNPVHEKSVVTTAGTFEKKAPQPAKETVPALENKNISSDEALNIALGHAGVSKENIRGVEVELDFERQILRYEISFECADYDYEYDIDAQSGKVIFSEKEFDR